VRRLNDALPAESFAWGPLGSYAFELAARRSTLSATSDLDLLIRADALDGALLHEVHRRCGTVAAACGVRIDVEVALAAGGVSLAECAAGASALLLKTADGPRLIACP